MTWAKTITLIVAIALVAGGAVWAYRLYGAPEPVEAVTPKWESSGHADWASESFVHWSVEDPAEIPVGCAKCHSTNGYHDYLGADGSTPGVVDKPTPIGGVLYCTTCHNSVSQELPRVVFPDGTELDGFWWEGNCMRCHQGRQSTASVNGAVAGLDADTVAEGLRVPQRTLWCGRRHPHGPRGRGRYEYPGKIYVGRYPHTEDFDSCIECHDPHSTAIDPETCAPCRANVVDYDDLFEIRLSKVDYDGDGDTEKASWARSTRCTRRCWMRSRPMLLTWWARRSPTRTTSLIGGCRRRALCHVDAAPGTHDLHLPLRRRGPRRLHPQRVLRPADALRCPRGSERRRPCGHGGLLATVALLPSPQLGSCGGERRASASPLDRPPARGEHKRGLHLPLGSMVRLANRGMLDSDASATDQRQPTGHRSPAR